jgi:serine/threonine protein kinase/Tol biopolymer transport system component
MGEERRTGPNGATLRVIRFGAFELDVRAGELRKHGVKIRLQEQPFQVLLALLERPGEVVLREEIRKKLWPNDTMVGFAASINTAVQRLRDALGDSADRPRYVETVARRGYRFIGEIAPETPNREPTDHPADECISEPSDLTGHTLSHYRIYEKLGRGGMGDVYRANDTQLGRDVALKVLPEELAHDADRMARFEREAHVLASLNHPNIAAIYGLEESHGIRAIVMELVEGPTLANEVARGAIPLEEALRIARQTADALEAAHEKGIVHRDIKPANIILAPGNMVKVLDFGLATVIQGAGVPFADLEDSPILTKDRVILGSAAYMAPEQARGQAVDKRADIWAFGVILYEMLTGERPFDGKTTTEILSQVLTKPPELDSVPARLRRLLRSCLEKDPRQRLRDIGDAWCCLDEVPQNAGASLAKPRSHYWAILAAGMLLIAALILSIFLWRSTLSSSQPMVRLNVELGSNFTLAGLGASAILSPDGRRVVYKGQGTDGKVRLYARPLNQEQSVTLTGTEGAESPFFSPDGQSIGFFADRRLKTILLNGGGPASLCEARNPVGASWGDDGNIVAALTRNSALASIPSTGGPVRTITELKEHRNEVTHRWPQVLPGARGVLFSSHTYNRDFDDANIDVQSLSTGERKTLVKGGYHPRYVSSGHLLFVRQDTLFAAPMDLARLELTGPATPVADEVINNSSIGFAQVDVSPAGIVVYAHGKPKQTLVWVEMGNRIQPLRSATAQYEGTSAVRFSPTGKQLALTLIDRGNADLWIYELGRETMTRLTFTPGLDNHAVWTPDGKHIAFTSSRHGGPPNVYWMRSDGAGAAVRLTDSKDIHVPFSFSPNGKQLVFSVVKPQTDADIWMLPLERPDSDDPKAGRPEPVLATPAWEYVPMISPDGRWLAYGSDESGTMQVYVRPLGRARGKWQISLGGGADPRWSNTRPELFFVSDEGIMVVRYQIVGEAFKASKPMLWAANKDLASLDLAPDGKRFAVVRDEQAETKAPPPVTFLLNFSDELRRRVPANPR